MSGYQEKIIRLNTQYEEKKQASEPDSDMTGILELSNQKCKTTMVNMLRVLNWQPTRRDGQCKQRDGNSKKELKINAKGQKTL